MDTKNKKQQIIIRIVCIMLSLGLWLYISNVENPTREYKLTNIPVEVVNEEALKEYKLALVPNQNFTVDLDLQGHSNDIYKVKKEQFKIIVDLSSYALKKGDNNVPIEIISYPSNINIKNNSFLRVNIILDNYVEKSMTIENRISSIDNKGAYSQKAAISPQTATMSGPESYVNKVKSLIVKSEVTPSNQENTMNLPIIPVDQSGGIVDGVKVDPGTAEVKVAFKKGKEVPIKVTTKGQVKDGLSLKSITPSLNKVEIIGDDSKIENIKVIETEPIDLSQINTDSEVAVKLKVPEGVFIVAEVSQVNVKVVLGKSITKEITLDIGIVGLKEGYKATLDNNKITLKVQGVEEKINALDISKITASVDLTNLTEGTQKVNVNIDNQYDNITIVGQGFKEVSVTITKEENNQNPNENGTNNESSNNKEEENENTSKPVTNKNVINQSDDKIKKN